MPVKNEFTDEELAICKETDLVQLCGFLGYKTKRVGNFYTIEEMDSVRIKNHRTYTRYSDDTGGSAIDLLINLQGMDFREAVRWLLDYHGVRHQVPDTFRKAASGDMAKNIKAVKPVGQLREILPEVQERQPFRLPNANYDYDRIYRYLCGERKLSREIVQFFVEKRMIYESVKTHNVVFVGRDQQGIARHASLRGTYNPPNGKAFKGVLPGSDARYSFNLISASNRLIVCEAPIDCMSYMDFTRDMLHDPYDNYLALCGTHDRALERFLRDNPQIKYINLALDADEPGQKACEKIMDKYTSGEWRQRNFEIMIDLPSPLRHVNVKDWNEFLCEVHLAKIEFDCQMEMEKYGQLSEAMRKLLEKEHLKYDPDKRAVLDIRAVSSETHNNLLTARGY